MQEQDQFFHRFVAERKKAYLERGEELGVHLVGFEKDRAWVIPFNSRDQAHRNMLLTAAAVAFRARGIERYGFVTDSWGGKFDLKAMGCDPKKLTKEELQAIIAKLRRELGVGSLQQYVKRVEILACSIIGKSGSEFASSQEHDSKQRKFLEEERVLTDDELKNAGGIAGELLVMGEKADLKKSPLTKDQHWRLMMSQFPGSRAFPLSPEPS